MGAGWQLWCTQAVTEPPMPAPIRLDSQALFEGGSATLKPGSTKLLVNALVGIKARPGWLIVIAGHTDASGAPEHNLALSHARATAVRDWMQRMGDLADSCFAVQGLAASQPLASNQTEAGACGRSIGPRRPPPKPRRHPGRSGHRLPVAAGSHGWKSLPIIR